MLILPLTASGQTCEEMELGVELLLDEGVKFSKELNALEVDKKHFVATDGDLHPAIPRSEWFANIQERENELRQYKKSWHSLRGRPFFHC